MNPKFEEVFAELKSVFGKHTKKLSVTVDTPIEYTVVTHVPSPFPQHKGHPMCFGCVRLGKAYVSFHLVPLYMNPPLNKIIPPALKKRMQGKACFNFKTVPDPETVLELKRLTDASMADWGKRDWA